MSKNDFGTSIFMTIRIEDTFEIAAEILKKSYFIHWLLPNFRVIAMMRAI